MSRVILLDSGPLGSACNPEPSVSAEACTRWLREHLAIGTRILIPAIADYEVRRELLRARKIRSIEKLDGLAVTLRYLPITTTAMLRAAELWADARQVGQPTAADKALDDDVILAAQALTLGEPDVIVATGNVAHLSRYGITALLWQEIRPES